MRLVILLIAAAFALAACNTVEGIGRDVRGAGKVIEKGAEKTKKAITN